MNKKIFLPLLLISIILLLPSITPASDEGNNEKPKLLVVPLKDKGGISKESASLLTDVLSVEIYKSGLFTILNREDMKAVLTEKEFETVVGCDDNIKLLRNVEKLAVNKVIAGSIGALGKKYIISIRLINVDGQNEIMIVDGCDCMLEELDEFIERTAHKFLDHLRGEETRQLTVESNPTDAKLYINGSYVGKTPHTINGPALTMSRNCNNMPGIMVILRVKPITSA